MWQEDINLTILFISGFASLFLALYVYAKGPKEKLKKSFSYLGLVVFFWCLADFLTIITKNVFWARLAHAFGSLIPLTEYFFFSVLLERENKKWVRFAFVGLALFFCYVSLTPLILQSITYFSPFGYDANFGSFFLLWSLYMVASAAYCFFIPIRALAKVEEKLKLQIPYFILGFGAFTLWVVVACIIFPFFGNSRMALAGSSSSIFIIAIVSYGIIKNQLLGIKSLFFRAFISSLVIVIITMILAVLMLLEVWFFTSNQPLGAFIIATLVATSLFFISQSFFQKTNALEKTKIELMESLKKSEQERLKAEEERNKTLSIIGNFSDGLIILDAQNKIFIINPEAETLLRINPTQVLGKPVDDLKNFTLGRPVVISLQAADGQVFKKEVRASENLTLEVSLIPLVFEKNNLGKLIVLHDVTREKIIEKMKTEFVSLAAHQLRTPLSGIKWSLKMFSEGDFGKLNKEQKEILEKTYTRNQYLIDLVNDLLDVTKIEEGRYLYAQLPINIENIIQSVIESYKDEARRKKVKVEFKSPGTALPEILGDAEKMKLAIENLIDNALRYTESGGKITVSLGLTPKEIQFRIADTGMGIPEKDKKNLFAKFFRGDNAVKMQTEGSGLGLFMTKNIIEAHHGKIWFDSEENKGTTFYFALPIIKKTIL